MLLFGLSKENLLPNKLNTSGLSIEKSLEIVTFVDAGFEYKLKLISKLAIVSLSKLKTEVSNLNNSLAFSKVLAEKYKSSPKTIKFEESLLFLLQNLLLQKMNLASFVCLPKFYQISIILFHFHYDLKKNR